MAFPQTLSGIIGFIIFVAFIVGMTLPNLNSQEANHITQLQTDFNNKLNTSITSNQTSTQTGFWGIIGTATGTAGIYDFIVGFFQIVVTFVQLALAYFGIFGNAIGGLPYPFLVLIALISSALIIQVIKLIFLSGD
jgi:hypothetical protein